MEGFSCNAYKNYKNFVESIYKPKKSLYFIKKMAKEFYKLGSIIFLLALFSVISVSASIISPANSGTVSGTYILNATNTTLPNMVNCTFYAFSPSTANSSWTSLGTFTNATANPLNINGTFASAGLEDSNDYTFNATCRNLSNSLTSSVTTATVIVSNSVPDAPSSISPSTNTVISTPRSVSISSTVTDAKTTGCTYTINRYNSASDSNSASGTATYSGSNCSFTFSGIQDSSDNGEYYIVFTASDGVSTTSNSPSIISVQIPGSGGGGNNQIIYDSQGRIVNAVEPVQSNNGYWIIGVVVAIAVIALIVLLIMFW